MLEAVLAPIVEERRTLMDRVLDPRIKARVISAVTSARLLGGARDVAAIYCDSSVVDPMRGVTYRGKTIAEIAHLSPEACTLLLLTGEIPEAYLVQYLREALSERRCRLGSHLVAAVRVVESFPHKAHPMHMFEAGLTALAHTCRFPAEMRSVKPTEYWKLAVDDLITVLAGVPFITGAVFQRVACGEPIPIDGARFDNYNAPLLWFLGETHNTAFGAFMDEFVVLHADHEGGNASAGAAGTAGSTLCSLFEALTAGMCALSGPLHGRANQDCLTYVNSVIEQFEGRLPSDEEIEAFVRAEINAKRRISGIGHAVLRVTDPRATALFETGMRICPNHPQFKVAEQLARIAPPIINGHRQRKQMPNVDIVSGSILHSFGIRPEAFTVAFGHARAIGIAVQYVHARMLCLPIFRPRSMSLEEIATKLRLP